VLDGSICRGGPVPALGKDENTEKFAARLTELVQRIDVDEALRARFLSSVLGHSRRAA
jgi:hypothetical protein